MADSRVPLVRLTQDETEKVRAIVAARGVPVAAELLSIRPNTLRRVIGGAEPVHRMTATFVRQYLASEQGEVP